jgi:hypothetical protein
MTMKKSVEKLDEAAVRRGFPIADLVPGWFFRRYEQSAGSYRVEGTDLWGRQVENAGTDVQYLLRSCAAAAAEFNRQLAAKGG